MNLKMIGLILLLMLCLVALPVVAQTDENNPRWCNGNGTLPDINTAGGWTWGEVNTSGSMFAGSGPGTTADALDGVGVLLIDFTCNPGTITGTYDAITRMLTVPPVIIPNGLEVSREIYFPNLPTTESAWMRYVDVVHNPGASSVTYQHAMANVLGAAGEARVIATSSGDASLNPMDRWIVADDATDPGGTAALAANMWGPGAAEQTDLSILAAGGLLNFSFSGVTVPAGETIAFMYFITLGTAQANATSMAQMLDTLPSMTRVNLSVARQEQIINWVFVGATDDAYSTPYETDLNITAPGVLANDIAMTAVTPANGATTAGGTYAIAGDGSFSYVPPAGFVGDDTFTYDANGPSQSTGTVTITVLNDAPIVSDDTYGVPINGALNVPAPGVLSNDTDPQGDALFANAVMGGNSVQGGVYTLNANGSFSYTPPLDFAGEDTFTYTATDGIDASLPATVTITVNNTAPIANDETYAALVGSVLNVAAPGVLTNDTDAEGGTISTILAQAPTKGMLTLNPDGGFVYVPNFDAVGSDSFTYYATDGVLNSVTPAIVTITLTTPEGMPPRVYPLNTIVLNQNNADWPQFIFQQLEDIEWYNVWIGETDYNRPPVLSGWYYFDDICVEGVCTLPVDLWLSNGDYVWWMTYWGPGTQNFGQYWNETTFVVNFAPPDANYSITAPTGLVIEVPTELIWERDTNTLWYQLWLGSADYSDELLFTWVNATQICDDTTCILDISELAFSDGEYAWWMEAWGPGGYVTWADAPANPATFTVTGE